jgi:hypothetical protein
VDWVCDEEAVESDSPTNVLSELPDRVNEIHKWGLIEVWPQS